MGLDVIWRRGSDLSHRDQGFECQLRRMSLQGRGGQRGKRKQKSMKYCKARKNILTWNH